MSLAWSFWDARNRVYPPQGYPQTPMDPDREDLQLAKNLNQVVNLVYTTKLRSPIRVFFVVENPYTSLVLGSIKNDTPAWFTKDLLHCLQFSVAMIHGESHLQFRKNLSLVLELQNIPDRLLGFETTDVRAKKFLQEFVEYLQQPQTLTQLDSLNHVLFWWDRMQNYSDLRAFRTNAEYTLVQRGAKIRNPLLLGNYLFYHGILPKNFSDSIRFSLKRAGYIKRQIAETEGLPLNLSSTYYPDMQEKANSGDLADKYFLAFCDRFMNKVLPGVSKGYLNSFESTRKVIDIFTKNLDEVMRVSFSDKPYQHGNRRIEMQDANAFVVRMTLGLVTLGVSEAFYAIGGINNSYDFQQVADSETQRQNYLYFITSISMLRHLFYEESKPDLARGTGQGMNSLVDLLSPTEIQAIIVIVKPILDNKLDELGPSNGISIPFDTDVLEEFYEKLRIILEVVEEEYSVYHAISSVIPTHLINQELLNENTTAGELRQMLDVNGILEAIDQSTGLVLLYLMPVLVVDVLPSLFSKLIIPIIIRNFSSGFEVVRGIVKPVATAAEVSSVVQMDEIARIGQNALRSLSTFSRYVKPFMDVFNGAMMAVTGFLMALELVSFTMDQQAERKLDNAFKAVVASLRSYMNQAEIEEERLFSIRSKILRSMNAAETKAWNQFRKFLEENGNSEPDVLLFYCMMTNENQRKTFLEVLSGFVTQQEIDVWGLSLWKEIVESLNDPNLDPTDEKSFKEFIAKHFEEWLQSNGFEDFIRRVERSIEENPHNKSDSKTPEEFQEKLRVSYMERELRYLPSEWSAWSYIEKLAYFSQN